MFGDFIAQYLISALKRYMRYCFSYMLVKFSSVRTIRDSGSITPPPPIAPFLRTKLNARNEFFFFY